MKRILFSAVIMAVTPLALAGAAEAQSSRLSVEPFVGYGFFGDLPEGGPRLEGAVSYGGRAGYALSPQFSLVGSYQRSRPESEGFLEGEHSVDHWSGGVEFSYVPRGGAEGMLPLILEVGLGQARYEYDGIGRSDHDDFAVNLGISSALQFTPNFAIRYGANDYISNYRSGDGVVNQIFVRLGAELTF